MIPPFTAQVPADEIETTVTAVREILQSGQLILGKHTEAFEATVARMAGTRYAVAVNSGTIALEIIFRSIGVQGRTVLVPTNTNYATAAAAINAGAAIRVYDSGLYPDITDAQRKLTPDVAAVVVVHIGGYLSPELPALVEKCTATGIPLVEDAAHAHGSSLETQLAGGIGYAGAFSFFTTKVVSTGGEGGAITTNDPDLNRTARMYRDQGKDPAGRHILWGGSWRMTEIGAALGKAQLDHLNHDIQSRTAVIDRYTEALSDAGLTFPTRYGEVSGHKCVTILDSHTDRARLREQLHTRGIGLGKGVYDQPLHTLPVLERFNLGADFPRADEFAARHMCLPLWRGMPASTVDEVIDTVHGCLTKG
ncbi:DegT/DnrJ/EryC1/StrS family aminotransferase [Nocardia carnea]|uniref:DegT/DnrJ/EryC1/StrS family aminotransferase n=1 Tax=Nocardia carnea TaxID=37328 RepID=UPI00031624A4|nr:DegT/DnrJ/EryC1/StrS family aminotransferase [Nocardia carnea]